jgi:predicted dehydrogenase
MPASGNESFSRRSFLKNTGRFAAATTLASNMVPAVYAGESHTIQVAFVGCGGRGTGAAGQALSVANGPIELVAMADVFPNRLASSLRNLTRSFPKAVKVPKERQFIGFDAYRHAMDCLKPGDVVILATPPAFRWVHFTYAIEKGLNVFMEKPVTVDGASTRRMLKLAEAAEKKNLKVGVGLMWRHAHDHIELERRIRDGQLGEIIALRAYRTAGRAATYNPPRRPDTMSELLHQVQRFHSFIWASGGVYSDFYVHHIDECCWMKGAWPVEAQALGGRHYRGAAIDQNLDTYSVEYTFADGTKFFYYGRNMTGCNEQFASFAHGSKGMAIISANGHSTNRAQIYGGQTTKSPSLWKTPRGNDCYQEEWNTLIKAIRNNEPYNEVKRGAEASLVTSMGRMAAHTGRTITFDQALAHTHELGGPDLDKLTFDSPSPLKLNADGKYPVPQPGVVTDREY